MASNAASRPPVAGLTPEREGGARTFWPQEGLLVTLAPKEAWKLGELRNHCVPAGPLSRSASLRLSHHVKDCSRAGTERVS